MILPKEKMPSLTPEKVMEDFKEKGVDMSRNDAEKYLDLLYFLSKLIVQQNLL